LANITPASIDSEAVTDALPVITIRAATKYYGKVHAVDGVDLEVGHGEIFGLIGHNGAGKSTLFKMMLGLTPITAGDILIDGTPVSGSGFRQVRRKIGYLPENVVLYDNLTGYETLKFFARLKGAAFQECLPALERAGLAHAANRRVIEYSKGMRQRLGFAQTLLGRPQILFLDEPTVGLDPEAIRGFYATLRNLKADGITVIMTSHILADIQERVDRLAIMAAGKIRAMGTVQSLREQINLPLWFQIKLADKNDEQLLRETLAHVQVSAIEAREDHIAVQCSRELKMKVLETLASLKDKIADIHVREPSLEDVFFGFAD
jgi:Cu-processing system ATP-binding protein